MGHLVINAHYNFKSPEPSTNVRSENPRQSQTWESTANLKQTILNKEHSITEPISKDTIKVKTTRQTYPNPQEDTETQ